MTFMQDGLASQAHGHVLVHQNLNCILRDLIQVLNRDSLVNDAHIRRWMQCVESRHGQQVHCFRGKSAVGHEPECGVEGIQRWSVNAGAVQNRFLGHCDKIRRRIVKFQVGQLEMRFIDALLGDAWHTDVDTVYLV